MTTHARAWTLALFLIAIAALAGCQPLPDYAYTFDLHLTATGQPTVTLTEADAPDAPGIFGDLTSFQGDQSTFLWVTVTNQLDGEDEITFWYLRQESGSDMVERIRLALGTTIYDSGEVVADGSGAGIPDDFRLVPYAGPDIGSGFGKLTGSIGSYAFTDQSGDANGEITIELTAIDALAYASEGAGSEPTPVGP